MTESLRLTLRSSLEELAGVAQQFDAFAASHGLAADVCGCLHLAIEEAITNVIKYGYTDRAGVIDVEFAVRGDDVIVTVADAAPAFDPLAQPPPKLDVPMCEKKPGGLGIHLVKKLMDGCTYDRENNRNVLTLRMRNGDR